MAKKNIGSQTFQFFTEIGIIEQLIRAKVESVLPEGIKISQFTLLNHLVLMQGQWSPARLASAFQVTRAGMTNTIQRLESRCLITIEVDPDDGRGKLVSLNSAGRNMHERCINNLGPLITDLENEIGAKNFTTALPFLEELRCYLDEHR